MGSLKLNPWWEQAASLVDLVNIELLLQRSWTWSGCLFFSIKLSRICGFGWGSCFKAAQKFWSSAPVCCFSGRIFDVMSSCVTTHGMRSSCILGSSHGPLRLLVSETVGDFIPNTLKYVWNHLNSFGCMQHLASGLGGPVAWRQKGELTAHAQVTSLSFGTPCIAAHIQLMMQESVLLRLSELFLRKQGANVLRCAILSYMVCRLREYNIHWIRSWNDADWILIGLLADLYRKPNISCNVVTS